MTGGELAASPRMNARPFSIGEAIALGWDTFKRNIGLSIGLAAGNVLTIMIVDGLAEAARDYALLASALGFLSQLLQVFWSLVWIRFALRVYDAREVRPRDLVPDAKRYLEFLAVSVLYALLVTAGLLLLVIPGIYLSVRYAFVGFLVADERAEVLDAFHQSSLLTKGARWRIFFLMLLLAVLNLVGALFFGLGLLFTIPTSLFAMARVYRQLAA
ncbi:MAG: hypothetical protein JWP87_2686, partial [Labilithrix sp.]|nr:hypothetical protein [Labilithrix sp.]